MLLAKMIIDCWFDLLCRWYFLYLYWLMSLVRIVIIDRRCDLLFCANYIWIHNCNCIWRCLWREFLLIDDVICSSVQMVFVLLVHFSLWGGVVIAKWKITILLSSIDFHFHFYLKRIHFFNFALLLSLLHKKHLLEKSLLFVLLVHFSLWGAVVIAKWKITILLSLFDFHSHFSKKKKQFFHLFSLLLCHFHFHFCYTYQSSWYHLSRLCTFFSLRRSCDYKVENHRPIVLNYFHFHFFESTSPWFSTFSLSLSLLHTKHRTEQLLQFSLRKTWERFVNCKVEKSRISQ